MLAVVVAPVFDVSNESPGVTDAGAVLVGRLKLETLVVADVVVGTVPLRPNPVARAFGVPNDNPVDPCKCHICSSILFFHIVQSIKCKANSSTKNSACTSNRF